MHVAGVWLSLRQEGLKGISVQDGTKYRCSLGLILWLNSWQVYGLRQKTGSLQLDNIPPQSVMQSGRLSVSILAGFRLGDAQANPEASCLALVRIDLQTP